MTNNTPSWITTAFGEAVPPAPRHSVTVHMPGWETVERYGDDSAAVIASFKNVYPRMKPHKDIEALASAVLKHIKASDQACLLFASIQSARECVLYATSSKRAAGVGKTPVRPNDIAIRAFAAKNQFFAVVYPCRKHVVVTGFWSTPGVGISSRFAEANLSCLGQLIEIPLYESSSSSAMFDTASHDAVRRRIIHFLDRPRLTSNARHRPVEDDVYLFPSGMAAIYKPHTYFLEEYGGSTVLFGMAFMNTLIAFDEFGPSWKFFGLGSDSDVDDLALFLEQEYRHKRKVQAIWAEFPANPVLVTPDLKRVRKLADEYGVVLAVDDTIGGFANTDVTSIADMTVTSLTKSFSGYADVIAGSVILNPSSCNYSKLKTLFNHKYVPELYVDDAVALERNSRDYLPRTIKLNSNAAALVTYLTSCVKDVKSAVRAVHYPLVNPSGRHYEEFIRPPTDEFMPGYGCLFSVEMDDLESTAIFYDSLDVHKGPHLGAPFTLAFAYTMCAYKHRLEWAAQYGLRPTQIRISAGLEDEETLLAKFRHAVQEADKRIGTNARHLDLSEQ